MIFQRRQKGLLWSKGLSPQVYHCCTDVRVCAYGMFMSQYIRMIQEENIVDLDQMASIEAI